MRNTSILATILGGVVSISAYGGQVSNPRDCRLENIHGFLTTLCTVDFSMSPAEDMEPVWRDLPASHHGSGGYRVVLQWEIIHDYRSTGMIGDVIVPYEPGLTNYELAQKAWGTATFTAPNVPVENPYCEAFIDASDPSNPDTHFHQRFLSRTSCHIPNMFAVCTMTTDNYDLYLDHGDVVIPPGQGGQSLPTTDFIDILCSKPTAVTVELIQQADLPVGVPGVVSRIAVDGNAYRKTFNYASSMRIPISSTLLWDDTVSQYGFIYGSGVLRLTVH